MNWNWNAIGAVGQILGSLATFVTVGFLAVQMHDSEIDSRREVAKTREEAIRALFMARAADAQLAELIAKTDEAFGLGPYPFVDALVEKVGLTRAEAYRISDEQAAWLNYRSQVFQYVDDLSPSDRALFENGIRATYRGGAPRLYLDTTMRFMAHPDFIRYIDNLLAQPN